MEPSQIPIQFNSIQFNFILVNICHKIQFNIHIYIHTHLQQLCQPTNEIEIDKIEYM